MGKKKRQGPTEIRSMAPALNDLRQSRIIDVEKFAEARSSELKELVSQLKGHNSNRRVFQSPPRYLRRRAASFNIRRLPVRLRANAERERELDKANNSAPKGAESRRKRRRNLIRSVDFSYRAGKHRWLETHIWHAKRMKMVDSFGYRVALNSNSRSVRSNVQAMRDAAVAIDASYTAVVEVFGALEQIAAVFQRMVSPSISPMPTAKRYLAGARYGTTLVYWPGSEFKQLIAPVTFLWGPTVDADEAQVGGSTCWMWVHPAAASELVQALADAVDKCRFADEQVHITHRDRELLKFILSGPRAHATLQAILDVVPAGSEADKAWKTMACLRSPSSLPADSVLALSVFDPRLSFPRKMPPRTTSTSPEAEAALHTLLVSWAQDGSLAKSPLWSKDVRTKLKSDKIPEAKLNERRRLQNFPGRPLEPEETDARIPILLLRRRCMDITSSGATATHVREFGSGWDLVVPAGWGNDFWKALVFAGARTGGLLDLYAMHTEMGVPSFPDDFPGTHANDLWVKSVAQEREQKYWGRPLAKRVPYAKLALSTSPFQPDYASLLQPATTSWTPPSKQPAASKPAPAAPSAKRTAVPKPAVVEKVAINLDDIKVHLLPSPTAQPSPRSIVLVSLAMTGKGVPKPGAQIYLRQGEHKGSEHKGSKKAHAKRPRTKDQVAQPLPDPTHTDDQAVLQPVSDVIGLVLSGGFSFLRGHGFAVAVCSAERLLPPLKTSTCLPVWVRNNSSFFTRPGHVTPLAIL